MRRWPMATGASLALAAAALFGATIPVIRHAGTGLGPFTTGTLLYAGAALGALRLSSTAGGPPMGREHLPRLVLVAALGAVVAPALLAWGLQRTAGITGALLLNFEAVVTLSLAALVYREHFGRRIALAAFAMLAGGALLIVPSGSGPSHALGAIAIIGAVTAWSLDNVLTRPLADLEVSQVVRQKALFGACASAAISLALREALPHPTQALVLVLTGLAGYGASLRLYLGAQRRIGAGRTGSLFAVAPFIGAAIAGILGESLFEWRTLLAAILFASGVVLHLTESHEHEHEHEGIEHEHAHRHDDGHHDHHHEGFVGEHSHLHQHTAVRLRHPHADDLHHRHRHKTTDSKDE